MRSERGSTLIELVIAAAILLVAMIGLVGVMTNAVHATSVGHQRTAMALLRRGLVDRLAVTPRDQIASVTGNTWIVDGCYDINSQLMSGGSNASHDPSFSCPAGSAYRTWLNVVPDPNPTPQRRWRVQLYAERTDPGCDSSDRYSKLACVAADIVLTD